MARRCRERSGQRGPCPAGLPVPPSPHALRAGPSEVAHPSSPRSILSAQAGKASPRSLPPARLEALPAAYSRGIRGASRYEACTQGQR